MAIQHRRGNYSNFDAQKMKPGEFAVVQSNDPIASDGEAVNIAFQAGTVKRRRLLQCERRCRCRTDSCCGGGDQGDVPDRRRWLVPGFQR